MGEQSRALMVREENVRVALFNSLLILLRCALLLSRTDSWFSRLGGEQQRSLAKRRINAKLGSTFSAVLFIADKVQDPIAFPEHRKDCTMVDEFAIGSKESLRQHFCQLLSVIFGFVFPTTPLAYI